MKLASAGVGCLAFAVTFLATGCSTPRREPPSKAAGAESSREATEEELDALARAERTAGRERRERIRAELRDATEQGRALPPWAGEFSTSRGYLTIAVAPGAGMTVSTSIDVVGTDRWNHGSIAGATDDLVDVAFKLPVSAPRTEMSSRFHFVRWARYQYLIPEPSMIEFCDLVNHGTPERARGRSYSFPFRESTDPRRAGAVGEQLPRVPEEFRKYFLARHIEGRIVDVERPRACGTYRGGVTKLETLVTVDLGRAAGLWPGMSLRREIGRGAAEGRIVEVADESCRVAFEHDTSSSKTVEALVVGALVTAGIDRTLGQAAADPDDGKGAVR